MGKSIDLTGLRFGRLIVLEEIKPMIKYRSWLCQCECGALKEIYQFNLRSGQTNSCGCLAKEASSKRETTHGMSKSPEFRIWSGMLNRCTNPNVPSYHNYGGRGIKVCKRWMKFENFYADMGKRPSANHSIDRINNNKGYNKKNCRWSTLKEQCRNRRGNVYLTYKGETKICTDWSKDLKIPIGIIYRRVKKGLPIEQVLSTSSLKPNYNTKNRKSNRWITYNGETKTATEWSTIMGIPLDRICKRVKAGWTDEQVLTTPIKKQKKTNPLVKKI